MKELLEIFQTNVPNFAAAFFGWLAFNVIIFRIEKDKFDQGDLSFPLSKYIIKTWDNWIASLCMIPVLIFVGYKQLDLGVLITDHNIKWSDAYYLLSGFSTELIIVSWTKWKSK